jgi:hypothetical protein
LHKFTEEETGEGRLNHEWHERDTRVSESSAHEELYQQQIEAMTWQIDALAYELYGLTGEKRKSPLYS